MKKYLVALVVGMIGLTLALLSYKASAVSTDLTPSVHLLSISAKQTAEQKGDELYMDIAVFPTKGKAQHFQIPRHPQHWPSEFLDKVDNVPLWKGAIPRGETVTLVFSLLEKDVPPWNTDDYVGAVRLHLKNQNGRLMSQWSIPNRVDTPVRVSTKYGLAEKVTLLGEDSNYTLHLLLKRK